jgi:hypothetical protein
MLPPLRSSEEDINFPLKNLPKTFSTVAFCAVAVFFAPVHPEVDSKVKLLI